MTRSRIVIPKPPRKFDAEISARLQQKRAQDNAAALVNEFRESIGYKPGENELTVIVGALRVLSLKAKELVP